MKILDLKVMRGPNTWSNYRQKLIVMRLDLGELEFNPTHHIEGFADRIKKLLPSLYGHRCSEGNKGGFFQRVEQGTWMGHVIEHIALEMQTLAGMDCGYGRTRSTDKEGVYNVVFAYRVEEAGLYAANAAVQVALALVKGKDYDINKDISELKEIALRKKLPGHTNVVIDEAHRAEIPFHLVNESLLILGYGVNQVKMRGTLAGTSSSIALEIASSKLETKHLLSGAQISVPQGQRIYEEDELEDAFNKIGSPLVVKPVSGYHGRKITLPLSNPDEARKIFRQVSSTYGPAMAEKAIEGDLFRVLFIDYSLVSVVRYKTREVAGDGESDIAALIEANAPGSQAGKGPLTEVVPDVGVKAWVQDHAEMYEGEVSPDAMALLTRVAKLCGLDVCCINVICKEAEEKITEQQMNIIAVEGRPDLTDFMQPAKGHGKNVILPIFEMLFAGKNKGRIPLIAVRGNGESKLISHLLAHICDSAGKKTGIAGSEGIQMNGYVISGDACRGNESVRGVLFDPGIDTAIVECGTEDILDSGLAFDTSEISIITGSKAQSNRRNSEKRQTERQCDLVVGRTTPSWGHLVLNADNDCDYLADELYGEITLYAKNPQHGAFKRHFRKGRLGAYIEEGNLVIQKGKWKTPLIPLSRIPLNNDNIEDCLLPAILAASILGFDTRVIASALTSFKPPEKTSLSGAQWH